MRTSKKVFWVTATALALGLTWTAVTLAAPGRRGRAGKTPDRPAMRQTMMDRLDLSDAQKEQLLEMRLKNRQEALRRRGKMAEIRSELQAEFLSDPVNESKVKSLTRDLAELRSQAMEARVDQRLAWLSVLTSDQRQELRKLRAMRARRFGEMHRRGMQGRFGPPRGSMRGGCCGRRGPGGHGMVAPRDRGMMPPKGGSGPCMGRDRMRGPGMRGAWLEEPGAMGRDGGEFLGDTGPDAGFGPGWVEDMPEGDEGWGMEGMMSGIAN